MEGNFTQSDERRKEGETKILVHLLIHRFGPLPKAAVMEKQVKIPITRHSQCQALNSHFFMLRDCTVEIITCADVAVSTL